VFEIGSSLREARMRRDLELLDVENATHIRARYLSALEEERFDLLPGTAYARGFLRAYADHLGLDAQRFVDEYDSRFVHEEMIQTTRPVLVRKRRSWSDFRLAAIPIGILLALIGWQLTRSGGPTTPALVPPLTSSVATTTGSVARTTTLVRPVEATPAPSTIARIRFVATRGPSWLDVRLGSQSGRELYVGTLQRAATVRFVGRRLWIRIGAPWNLDAALNGTTVPLGARTGDVLVTPTAVTPAG